MLKQIITDQCHLLLFRRPSTALASTDHAYQLGFLLGLRLLCDPPRGGRRIAFCAVEGRVSEHATAEGKDG